MGAVSGSRFIVGAESPLTGAIACSTSGGRFGPELRFAGYGLLIVMGKSPLPVYLPINDARMEVRPGLHLWGRTTHQTEEKGAFIPSCAIAGGISLEDHIFKAIALASPYIKAVCMGRATLTAAMVGKTHGRLLEEKWGDDRAKYREQVLQVFTGATKLKEIYGGDFHRIPPSAIAMYTYYDRLSTGLRQLMAGARKFALEYVDRDDLMALTREAADVSAIPYVMDADQEEIDEILGIVYERAVHH